MRRTIVAMAIVALMLTAVQPARADFETGQRAWNAGSVDEAVSEWGAAADASDRRAMLALGRLYVQGLGVLQDYVEAHKWFNLAASRGETAALEERDALATKMTPEERAEAQKLARAWRPGGGHADSVPNATVAQAPTAVPNSSVVPDRGAPPQAIREAQTLLRALGYRPGPADGIWGRRTGEAYRAFLRDAGLPAGKTLTPDALRAMRALAKRHGGGDPDTGQRVTTASAAVPALSTESTLRLTALPPDALHRAAQAGDIVGLTAAIDAGVDVNARDRKGWTALMHAVDRRYPLLVESLLEANADPNIRAPDGATPLFMAAVHGQSEIIEQLMQAEADITIKGPDGKTSVDVARTRYGDVENAQQSKEPASVLALLRGKSLAEVDAERLAQEAKERERLARERKPGRVFRDCEGCPKLVVIPAGSYTMGSPSGEKGRKKSEGPAHTVTIARSFAVGVYEVTYAEWDACRREGGCNFNPNPREWGVNRERGATQPVVSVNWNDAQQYVRWLSRKTGNRYRLLSEGEWEYVARAESTTRFWWGNELGRGRANCYRCQARWSGTGTASVGSFSPNPFGLYDVHGNAREWTEDCWHPSYAGAPRDGRAWKSGGDCNYRILRGGSYFGNLFVTPSSPRSAAREGYGAGARSIEAGFRVARTLD